MATKIWDGGAGDNVIGTAANWDGDAAPSESGDDKPMTGGLLHPPL